MTLQLIGVLPLYDMIRPSDDKKQDPRHSIQHCEGHQEDDRQPVRAPIDHCHQGRHVRVKLEDALDCFVIAPDRQIALDQVPVHHRARESTEIFAKGKFACRYSRACRLQKTRIVALVRADLTGLGGIDRASVQIINLDLEHGQAGRKGSHRFIDFGRFRPRPQSIPVGLRDRHHVMGESRPQDIGEGSRQGDVLVLRRGDELLHRVVPV